MQQIAILGRQPELSLAELESRLGHSEIQKLTDTSVLLSSEIDLTRFGGTLKIAELIDTQSGTDWTTVFDSLIEYLPKKSQKRLTIGASIYGVRADTKKLNRKLLELKKVLRADARSVRIVPSKTAQLNSATVIHNKLADEAGFELIVVVGEKQMWIGKTTAVQHIDAYTKRDRDKPVRDTHVGMLPPKLAQILLNLAQIEAEQTVLDPFCGTGTVLMEAFMQNLPIYGSDLSNKMIEATQTNLDWLAKESKQATQTWRLQVADATTHYWEQPFDAVVTETYLGPPMRHIPRIDELNNIMKRIDDLHRNFLLNIGAQLPPGAKLCLAVPTWHISGRMHSLKMVDDLEKMGYTRASFELVDQELIYRRDKQVVGRHILVLTRK